MMNRLRFVIWSSALNVQWCYRFRVCILLRVIKFSFYKYRQILCNLVFVIQSTDFHSDTNIGFTKIKRLYFKIVTVLCTQLAFIRPLVHFRLQGIDNGFNSLKDFQRFSLKFSDIRFDHYPVARRRTSSALSGHDEHITFFKRQFQLIGY